MQKREVIELLDGMVKAGFLLQESPGRYRRNAADLFLTGTFVRDHSRLSIVPDKGGDTLYVSENNARQPYRAIKSSTYSFPEENTGERPK